MRPIWVLWSLFLGLFLGAAISTYWNKPSPSIPGQIAHELAGKPTITETIKAKVYPVSVNKTLGVPVTQKVLTAIKVDNKTISAAINEAGDTTLYVRRDPLPWFSKEKKYSGSLDAVWMDTRIVYRGRVTLNMAQTKNIHWGVSVWVDKHPEETKIYTGVGFNW